MKISTALYKRLYQAIREDRKTDAVLFLSQVFDQQNLPEQERYHAFLSGLRLIGDDLFAAGQYEEAQRYYELALALFDKFFADDVREGLALNRRLCELYERQGADEKLEVQMDRAFTLVRRMLAEVSQSTEVSQLALEDDMVLTGTTGGASSAGGAVSESANVAANDLAGRAVKILLIEDNPDDVGLVEASLEGAGFPLSLDWAETLEEGMARLQQHPVDVVLLDLTLPDSQNGDTIRSLRADAPRVPIVVLTGNDDSELILEALRTGARDYLIKGRVDASQLISSLNGAVQSRITGQATEWENKLRLDTLRQLLRFVDTPAIVLDTKYGIAEVNERFCETMPCAEDQLRGASFLEICPHFPRTEFDEMLQTGGRRSFPGTVIESRAKGAVKFTLDVGAVRDGFHNVRWLLVQLV